MNDDHKEQASQCNRQDEAKTGQVRVSKVLIRCFRGEHAHCQRNPNPDGANDQAQRNHFYVAVTQANDG